jgi:hypothetical protein
MDNIQHTQKIGIVMDHLLGGGKASRKGWHGKGMFVFLERGSDTRGHTLVLSLPNGHLRPGWNASTEDLLASDWGLF